MGQWFTSPLTVRGELHEVHLFNFSVDPKELALQVYSLEAIVTCMQRALGIQARHYPIPPLLLNLTAYLIERFSPAFLSREHLWMLKTPNVADPQPLASFLQRPLTSVDTFFKTPSNYRRHGGPLFYMSSCSSTLETNCADN